MGVQQRKIVISDLDGTLADLRHRLHYIKRPPASTAYKDWDSFFEACDKDKPIEPTIAVIQSLAMTGYPIVILSGRNERVREKTLDWLVRHHVPFSQLIMRPRENRLMDNILKKKMADQHNLTPENVLGIFDDRKSVVDMWRRNGFQVWHVAEGDF